MGNLTAMGLTCIIGKIGNKNSAYTHSKICRENPLSLQYFVILQIKSALLFFQGLAYRVPDHSLVARTASVNRTLGTVLFIILCSRWPTEVLIDRPWSLSDQGINPEGKRRKR